MDYTTLLQEKLARGQLVLFLGGDVSSEVTGMPSRADLAGLLARRYGLDETLSLATVAQRIAHDGNRNDLIRSLVEALDSFGRVPQEFHRLVAQLPIATIITTAYDNLLEAAFREAGQPLNCLVTPSDIPLIDPRRRTLIKLYGDVQQRTTLVVTEDDHIKLWRNPEKQPLLDEVRSIVSRHTVLFLGYNLADPDMHLLWRDVLERLGTLAAGAYVAWPGSPDDERQVWEGRTMRLLNMEPVALLRALAENHTDDDSHQRGSRTRSPRPMPTRPIRDRYALVIGVNRYIDPAIPSLRYAVKDGQALGEFLTSVGYHVRLLHDQVGEHAHEREHLQPTRDNIEATLEEICQIAGEDDLIWVHFSGHGRRLGAENQPVLLTREVRLAMLQKRALRLATIEERMRQSKARRLVITIDACQIGTGREVPDPEFLRNVHDLAEGFALLAASTADQQAYESQQAGHGLFTHALLSGLRGHTDHAQRTIVTVHDVEMVILDQLRRASALAGWAQYPTTRTEGVGDMILVDYREKSEESRHS